MPYDAIQKQRILAAHGYDPTIYDLSDDLQPVPKAPPTPPPLPPKPPGALETFGRAVGKNIGPSVAGQVASILTGAATAPLALTGPAGLLADIGLSAGAGLGASYGAGRLQEPLFSAEYNKALAEGEQAHPIASLAGEIAPLFVTASPASGAKLIGTLPKLPRALLTASKNLSSVEKNLVRNAAVNAAVSGGTDVALQAAGDQPYSIGETLKNTLLGGLFAEPNRLGQRLGARPTDIPDFHRERLAVEAQQKSEAMMAQKQAERAAEKARVKAEEELLAKTGGEKGLKDYQEYLKTPTVTPEPTNKFAEEEIIAAKEAARIPDEARRLEIENRARQEQLAKERLLLEQQKSRDLDRMQQELEASKVAEPSGDPEAEALGMQKALEEGRAAQKLRAEPYANRELIRRKYYEKALESVPEPLGDPQGYYPDVLPEISGPTKPAVKPSESLTETPKVQRLKERFKQERLSEDAMARLERRYKQLAERYQSEDLTPAEIKTLEGIEEAVAVQRELRKKDPRYDELYSKTPVEPGTTDEVAKNLAEKRGIKLEYGEVLDAEGNPVAGSYTPADRIARVSPTKGGKGTVAHEVAGHGFLEDLLNSKDPRDQKLAKDLLEYNKVAGESELDAKERLARDVEANDLFRIRESMTDSMWKSFKRFLRDIADTYNYKIKATPGSSEWNDAVWKVYQQRLQHDAPYGQRAELNQKGSGVYYSRSPEELDREYRKALAANDAERMRGLVDERARDQGYTEDVYHGSYADFRAFDTKDNKGVSVTPEKSFAYNWNLGKGHNKSDPPIIYELKLNPGKRASGLSKDYEDLRRANKGGANFDTEYWSDMEHADQLKSLGYDSTYTVERPEEITEKNPRNTYVMDPARVKFSGMKSYDENGKIIPLSKRFDPTTDDIYYSKIPLEPWIARTKEDKNPQKVAFAKGAEGYFQKSRQFLGELREDPLRRVRKLLGISITNPLDYLKMDNESARRVHQYGQEMQEFGQSSIALKPNEQQAYDIIRNEIFDKAATMRNERGAQDGSSLRNSPLEDFYWAHTPDRVVMEKVMSKPQDPEVRKHVQEFIDYQIDTGRAKDEEGALALLAQLKLGYSKGEQNAASTFGPMDKAAGIGLPPSWREKNLFASVGHYATRAAKRLAFHDTMETPEVKEALTDPLNSVRGDDNVKSLLSFIEGNRPAPEQKREALMGVVKSLMLGPLTGAKDFAGNPFQALAHVSGPVQWLKANASAFRNFRDNLAESFKAGVNRENITTLENIDETEGKVIDVLRKTREIASVVQGRNALEQGARAQAYGIGKFLAQDFASKPHTFDAQKFFRKFNDGQVPKTAEEFQEVAARVVENMQGSYDPRGLPRIAIEGSFSPFLSLSRWSIEKFNNFQKDVIIPATKGDLKPLLFQTLGAAAGGVLLEQIQETATGKKSKAPTTEEIAHAKNKLGVLGYKAATLASLSGYSGILGDLAKSVMDRAYGNKPQSINNPLFEAMGNTADTLGDAIEAFQSGELEVGVDALSKIMEDQIQSYRLILAHASADKKRDIERANKFRDYRMYSQIEGGTVPTSQEMTNPFLGSKEREFKRTEDLDEARRLLREDILPAIRDQEPEKMRQKLRGLKQNSYKTLPSPQLQPLEYRKYLNWIRETQGEDYVNELRWDYRQQNQKNRIKGGMIPSLLPRM